MFKLYYKDNIIRFDQLQINTIDYLIDENSKENKGFIGFFDWLRKDERTIIGIRTCFFEHQEYNALLEKFKYTKSTYGEKFIEILFTTEGYNPLLSGDQDFTNNYVYTSDNGDYLFTFGLDHLTEYELNSLLKHCEILT